jgi:hypothetical protein
MKRPIPIDWSTDFSEEEWSQLASYYSLGSGNLDLFRFAPFMYALRPDALKRYRLWVNTVTNGVGLENPLPGHPYIQFVMCPFYCVIGYQKGLLTEITVARQKGARKAEVADVLALAWLHAGPYGMNLAAEAVDSFMRLWQSEADGPGVNWPAGWKIDPDAFLTGVDFSRSDESDTLPDADLKRIEDWHRRVQGEVPDYVHFFSQHYPLGLRVFRARYENALQSSTLPPQLVALTQVHLAASLREPAALRRALRMARYFGVDIDKVVQIIALSQLYLGELAMDAALQGVDDSLSAWK